LSVWSRPSLSSPLGLVVYWPLVMSLLAIGLSPMQCARKVL
jgi:hypothetical protein